MLWNFRFSRPDHHMEVMEGGSNPSRSGGGAVAVWGDEVRHSWNVASSEANGKTF